jgi:hypothetical protein
LDYGGEVITFNGKTYENIGFTYHVYDQWNGVTVNGFKTYLNAFKEKGFATFCGEYGMDNVGTDTKRATSAMMKAHQDLKYGRVVWAWYGGDDNKLFEGEAIGLDKKAGWRGWTIDTTTCGSDAPTASGVIDITTGEMTSGEKQYPLTWLGKLVWDDNHREENCDWLPGYPEEKVSSGSLQILSEGNGISDSRTRHIRIQYDNSCFENTIHSLLFSLDGRKIGSGRPFSIENGILASPLSLGMYLMQNNQKQRENDIDYD